MADRVNGKISAAAAEGTQPEEVTVELRKVIPTRNLDQSPALATQEGLGSSLLLKNSNARMLVRAQDVPESASCHGSAIYVGVEDAGEIAETPGRNLWLSAPKGSSVLR